MDLDPAATTSVGAEEVRVLKARDQESRRLLEDANGWLKCIVIADAMDYDRAKDGLSTLIEEIRQHITMRDAHDDYVWGDGEQHEYEVPDAD